MSYRPLALIVCTLVACAPERAPTISTAPSQVPPLAIKTGTGEIALTRIGHAATLIEIAGAVVLTDPWFSETSAYHPGEPLGMQVEKLPKLSLVLGSHAHYDHFDIETFAAYPDKSVPMLVGPDMVEKARAQGFTAVQELQPWQTATVGPLTITAAPGKHGVPEVTYVIQGAGQTVYFGGDTMLIPELEQELPKRFPSIQLAVLAVNGLHAMGSQKVMTDQEAARLAGALKAEVAVPMHYRFKGNWFTDTFILSRKGTAEGFVEAAKQHAPTTQTRVLEPGQRQVLRPAQ